MSCDIYTILQKQSDSQNWETVLVDVLQLSTSPAREFCSYLTNHHVSAGIPKDVFRSGKNKECTPFENGDYYLGCYGHHFLTLEEFCQFPLDAPKSFSVEQGIDNGWIITIPDRDAWSLETILAEVQTGYIRMFSQVDLARYRLVIGFS